MNACNAEDDLRVRIRASIKSSAALLGIVVVVAGCAAEAGPGSGVDGPGNAAALEAVCREAPPEVEVFEQDAQFYADDFGVSLEEAMLRLALQGVEGLGEAGQEAAPELWAGMWLEHEPEFGFVLFYKGEPEVVAHVRAATEDCLVPVTVRSGAEYSESELRAGMKRLSDSGRLEPPMPGLSMYSDVKAGVIVLGGPIDPGAEVLAAIEEVAGVPVRYVQEGSPTDQ